MERLDATHFIDHVKETGGTNLIWEERHEPCLYIRPAGAVHTVMYMGPDSSNMDKNTYQAFVDTLSQIVQNSDTGHIITPVSGPPTEPMPVLKDQQPQPMLTDIPTVVPVLTTVVQSTVPAKAAAMPKTVTIGPQENGEIVVQTDWDAVIEAIQLLIQYGGHDQRAAEAEVRYLTNHGIILLKG